MDACLSNDHATVAMPHQYAGTGAIENVLRRGDIGLKCGLRNLCDIDGVAIVLEDVYDWPPSRAVRERTVDQNNTLDRGLGGRHKSKSQHGSESECIGFHSGPRGLDISWRF